MMQVEVGSLKAYLTDFGISKLLLSTKSFTTTMCQGTPGFISPEKLVCMPPSTGEDVYAFGGVLYELFSEHVLWEGLLPYQIITKVITGNKSDISNVKCAAICEICSDCFQPIDGRPTMVKVLNMLIHMND